LSKDKLFYQLQDYTLLRTSLEKVKLTLQSSRTVPWGLIGQELDGLFRKGLNDPSIRDEVQELMAALEGKEKEAVLIQVSKLISLLDDKIRSIYSELQR
jgi:hypothetical protein